MERGNVTWFFRKQEVNKRASGTVEYIKLADGEILIRTSRPGEKPFEAIAEAFPPQTEAPSAVEPERA
jgi:hypothetical protein